MTYELEPNSLKGLHLDKDCNNPYSETNNFGSNLL
jgi:hypothetical protein